MPKFVVFMYDDESQVAGASPEELAATGAAHGAFAQQNGPSLRGGGRLGPASDTVSIVGGGDGVVKTAPILADAGLQIGGYYIIEADDTEAAVEIAKQVPSRFGGGVEVRPLIG